MGSAKTGGPDVSMCAAFLARTVGEGDVVLAAVSGGADSMAMLDVLLDNQARLGIHVEVAHIHHHLREASDAEWIFVENYCEERGVPFHGRHIDVRGAQAQSGRSMEAEAHRLRHEALREIMKDCGARWLALAHHANDRAETVLMNLLRGTSAHGLATMTAQNGNLIRPMLNWTRADIEAYCVAKGISWVTDESNADTTILRNRLRHELLPALASYNPAIVEALNRLAESCECEQDYIHQSVAQLEAQAMVVHAAQWCLFERAPLAEAHEAVIAALLREMAEGFGPERHGLRFDMVKQVLALLKEGHGRYDLGQGVLFECTKRWVYIGKKPSGEWKQKDDGWHHDFLEAHITIPEALNTQLAVRFPQSGDAIRLTNLGHKQLKKLFQEKGVPSVLRTCWPIVYDIKTKEVIWIPFLAQSSLLMYYNSVTFLEVDLTITIAGQTHRLTF